MCLRIYQETFKGACYDERITRGYEKQKKGEDAEKLQY